MADPAIDPFAQYDTAAPANSNAPAAGPGLQVMSTPTAVGAVATQTVNGQTLAFNPQTGKYDIPTGGGGGTSGVMGPVAPAKTPVEVRSTPQNDPFAQYESAATAPAAATPTATPVSTAPTAAPPTTAPTTTPQTPPGVPPLHPFAQQELRNQPWYQPIYDAVQTLQGGAGAALHGATMGFDEIANALVPAIEKSLSKGIPFTQAYEEAVQEQSVPRRQFEALHPSAGSLLELAGGAVPAALGSPLYAAAPKGAGLLARGAMAARNAGVGAGTGAVAGFGGTEGGLAERVRGAETGAAVGAGLAVAAPLVTAPAAKLVAGIARPMSKPAGVVGNILNEVVAEGPPGAAPVKFEPSPIAGAPLDIAQASGNPELAQLADARNAANLPNQKRMTAEQANALIQRIPGGPGNNIAPESAAARGSRRFTAGVASGTRISNTEEKRVWNTPALEDKAMTSASSKEGVNNAILAIQRDHPGLDDVIENSPVLRGIVKDLVGMPGNVSANELNSIASRFKKASRDPNQNDNVRLVAQKLGGAAHDSLWNAPEVTGRPAQTIPGLPARVEMHAQPDGTVVPVHIAATPPTVIPEIKPIPGLVRDLNAARDFTKQEAQTFGHASFENIVARNSYGNQTVTPGTAANRFFDFTNGTETPGAIRDATSFLNDIKSEWLKLGLLGTKYDPASVAMAQTELKQGLREYISAKFLAGISNANTDMRGNQGIAMEKAADFLGNNRDMLRNTGIYTPAEMDAWKEVEDYSRMVARGRSLGKSIGSPTYTRLASDAKWLRVFMNPMMSSITGTALGAALGATVGDTSLGVILGGLEGGVAGGVGTTILRAMYNSSREKSLKLLDEAVNNPVIAADLMRRASAKVAFSQDTKRWLRSWLVGSGTEESTRAAQPALEPAQ